MDATTSKPMRTDPLVEPALNRAGVPRLDAIDMLRGLVIVLMVLDHVRDFFHVNAYTINPTNPAATTPVLYLTRWVTHLCAPTFVFLAGVSIYLQQSNGKTRPELSKFLLTRGVWLIVLEQTIISFGFNFAWPFLFLQVIWAIGVSMLLLAALVWVPPRAVLILGAVIVAGHGLLGPVNAKDLGSLALLWQLAFEPGFVPGTAFIAYPAIPWFGIMCLGYGLGFVFVMEPDRRRRAVLSLAAGAVVLFLILRWINGYGDPARWRSFDTIGKTVMSFFNVSKYPPSLLYALITLGVSLALLPLLERLRGPLARPLLAFGRTPFFTYLLHIYVAHGAAVLAAIATGQDASVLMNMVADPSRAVQAKWGFNLLIVYIAWLLILVAMYPLSRWFADVKRRRRDWWLSYL